MNEENSFKEGRIYTEDEIRSVSSEVDFFNNEGMEYLIAQADLEYWFIREGEGWKVDHTWKSVILTKKN